MLNTCCGSLKFHVINIRTEIEFVFFAGGFDTPCILTRSNPVKFANPKQPLYGHLSSIDSTGTSVSNKNFAITLVYFLLHRADQNKFIVVHTSMSPKEVSKFIQ